MTLEIRHKSTTAISATLAAQYGKTIVSRGYYHGYGPMSTRMRAALLGHKSYGNVAVAVGEDTSSPLSNSALLLDRTAGKLESFVRLPFDWDSYGAEAVTPQAVQQGLAVLYDPNFLQLLPRHNTRLSVFPRRDGGVQLDVDGGPYGVEIVVSATGQTEYTFFDNDNEVIHEAYSLSEAVTWLQNQID